MPWVSSEPQYKRHNQMTDFMCLRCGAVVNDPELHNKWYDDQVVIPQGDTE